MDDLTTLKLRINGEDRPVVFPTHHTLLEVLRARGVDIVDWAGWQQIDAAELVKGEPDGRNRVKIHEWAELLAFGTSVRAVAAGGASGPLR